MVLSSQDFFSRTVHSSLNNYDFMTSIILGRGMTACIGPLQKKHTNNNTLLLKEGIRKVLENELPSSKDGITPEGKTLH